VTLAVFFETMGPFLRGQTDLEEVRRRLGPLPTRDDDLRFYAELVAFDQQRILAELVPAARRWIERVGLDWASLVRAFVAEHPPTGWSVPHVGEHFADWLAARHATDPLLPTGIEAVVDLAWTRFLVRTAPEGPTVEIRHYPVDAVALTRTLLAGEEPDPRGPTTLLVYRHVERCVVSSRSASLATVAVLLAERGQPLAGPLATLTAETIESERRTLVAHGVLAPSLT
jgi:hypothetical protein